MARGPQAPVTGEDGGPARDAPAPARLQPSVSRRQLVDRPRLTGLVERMLESRVTVVRAPAGYGKTSLLAQWHRQATERGRRAAWLALDSADADPARLAAHLLDAAGAASGERGIEWSPLASDAPGRIDAVASLPPLVLFLDELEHLRSDGAQRLIERLVEIVPAGSAIVIATREAPRFPLAALRVRGALFELALDDLRFTEDEAEQMFERRAVRVDRATIVEVLGRTEGWAAALALMTLAVAHRVDPHAFVRGLTGSRRDVADFLAEEVFLRQPQDVRRFLLDTSILERLCAPLCDAITGGGDARSQLDALERSGLFLFAADEEGTWYRYHALFAEFLRDRLGKERPGAGRALHRAAAEWHAARGHAAEAVHHAFETGDLELAASTVEPFARQTFFDGQLATLARWIDGLPDAVLDDHPAVREAAAWGYACLRNGSAARRQLEALRRIGRKRPLAASTRDALAAVEAVVCVFEDRGVDALELSRKNAPRLSGTEPFVSAALQHVLAVGLIAESAYLEARSTLVAARANNERAGSRIGTVYSIALLGLCEAAQGNLEAALARYDEAKAVAGAGGGASPYVTTVVAAYLAEVLYERNDLDAAEALLLPSFDVLTEAAIGDMVAVAYLTRARLHAARSAFDYARRALDDAEAYALRTGFHRLAGLARWERVRLSLAEGRIDEARRIRERIEVSPGEPGYVHHASETEALDVGELRLLARSGAARRVLPRIRALHGEALACGRGWRALRLKIVEAEALDAARDRSAALRALLEAMRAGAAQGFVRSFLDEGAGLAPLMRAVAARFARSGGIGDVPGPYVERLLAGFGLAAERGTPEIEGEGRIGDLSDRERQILALVAEGLSNRELGKRLFVTEHTVKWHLLKVFQKLGVRSRAHAIAVARRIGILPG